MLHSRVENRAILAPLLLSLAAVATYAMSGVAQLSAGSMVAELLLFLAALAFSVRGSVVAVGIGVLPLLADGHGFAFGSRLAILIVALGLSQRYLRMVPGYVTALITWLALVSPAWSAINALSGEGIPLQQETLVFALVQDMLAACLAGALLFNDSVWWTLTGRSRFLNNNQIIPYLMTATSLTALFTVAIVVRDAGLLDDALHTTVGTTLGTTIVAGFILIPTVFGYHISRSLQASGTLPLLTGQRSQADSSPRDNAGPDSIADDSWSIVSGIQGGGQGSSTARNSLDVGVCAIDEEGAILFVNDRFKSLAQSPGEHGAGSPFAALGEGSELAAYIWQLVCSTAPSEEHIEEIRVSGREDGVKFIEINLRPHEGAPAEGEPQTESGRGSPRVIRLSDITARRTIDDRLSRIQRNKALSACARAVAPRLSEAFTAILGRASHALHAGDPAALSSALRNIAQLAGQGGVLVQQLNELAVPPEAAARVGLDLALGMRERLPLLQSLVGDSIEIQLQAATGQLPVRIDTALLTQSLCLIVMNSAEAYQDGRGRISISVGAEELDELVCRLHPGSRPGNFARVSISDFGRGMPPEVLAKVANPLLTQRGEYGHIGLDLPSVLAVMSEHDGFMTVESRPERGTTVSLYFPLTKGAEAPLAKAATARPGTHGARGAGPHHEKRVLIVEDSPELRSLLHDMVKSLGYRSATCTTKDEALKLMQAGPIDIVVVEEALPGASAQALVSEAHAQNSKVKTVLLSTALNRASQGSDSVLMKPFDLHSLARILDHVAESGGQGPTTTPQ